MSFGLLHAIANIVNFLLFVFIVVKFAGPPIAKNVEDRRQAALDAIKEATEANRKALASLDDTRARLANVDGELATMLDDARKIGLMQAASIEEATRQDIERLHLAAKAEIERQRQGAVQEVRSLLMRQAFERAALELQQSMTPERQRELVNGVVQKVGDGSLALM
jgi:F-type H+-transporting ATPase subunit b